MAARALTGGAVPGRQRVLPWKKAVDIAVQGLRVRLGRSLITAGSIVLATAFLAFTLGTHEVLKALIALNDQDVNFLLQRRGIDLEDAGAGLAAREIWLVATSMVVCLVGVTNALAMSVSERIKEIGTMKCLGALDSFVVRLFLIEALFVGSTSSAAGAVAGIAGCLGMGAALYGAAALAQAPVAGLLLAAAGTVVIGTFLSVLAAIYPSLIAARMQPVEAMRKEV